MAKRFVDTEIFDEDWFLSLSGQEMLFWQYVCLKCDHAGIWRPNFKSFEINTGFRINQEQFLNKVNSDIKRIQVLSNGKWWVVGFIKFQYCKNNKEINTLHRVQKSALEQLENNQVDYKLMGYILRVNEISLTLKEKEKEKDILSSLNELKHNKTEEIFYETRPNNAKSENDTEIIHNTPGLNPDNGRIKKPLQKNRDGNKSVLFKDSKYYDFGLFRSSLPKLSDSDCKRWYEECSDYSAYKGAKYIDWPAAVRTWIRRKEPNNTIKPKGPKMWGRPD